MAIIEPWELREYDDLLNYTAWKELAEISRVKKLKRGETGFSPEHIKNFTIKGHTCSPQVREMILNYFKKRAELITQKL